MVQELEDLHKRVEKIEKLKKQELLTLVEILSNANFFGEIKRAYCNYAKNGQCSYFFLKNGTKNKIPIATECRIDECKNPSLHCHIELSNISCSLCQKPNQDAKQKRLNRRSKKTFKIQKRKSFN